MSNMNKESKLSWQRRIFFGMYAGLSTLYLARRALGLMVPEIMEDIGITKSQWGTLGTAFAVTYGISKLTAGIFTDTFSARLLLSTAVATTGVANIIFSYSQNYQLIALVWSFNGFVQGMGFAPCAKLLKVWWEQNQRGTWWGMVSTAQNFGNCLLPVLMSIPMISQIIVVTLGWRSTLFASGVICLVMSIVAYLLIRDDPSECQGKQQSSKKKHARTNSTGVAQQTNTVNIIRLVLSNENVWILGFAYFFIYIIRSGIADWAMLILTEHLAHPKNSAATCMLLFEIGGFAGGLSAGWISDTYFKGNRVPMNILFMVGNTLSLLLLTICSRKRDEQIAIQEEMGDGYPVFWIVDALLMLATGFFIFGPITLVGILSTELMDKKGSGTALGIVGGFAAAGATVAGWPMGWIAQHWGWEVFLIVTIMSALLSTLLLTRMLWTFKPKSKRK